jgi:hypothetical protein
MAKDTVATATNDTPTTQQPLTGATLFVERETFKGRDNGQEYWSYFVRGTIRGREVKVSLIPPDKGGYEVLDIVFIGAVKLPLKRTENEMTDDVTKRRTTYLTYTVTGVDENGEIYDTDIKPARKSDKSLLEMLYRGIKG